MAGRSNGLIALLAAFLLALLAREANAEAPRGQSRELGLKFAVQGGDQWCASEIRIHLTAKKTAAFTGNAEGLQQTLGRIRGVVSNECPAVSKIMITGLAGGKEVYRAAMWRLARWRLIEVDADGRPRCGEAEAGCEERRAAFLHLVALMSGPAFSSVEFTAFLDPASSSLVEWRDAAGNVGQMKAFRPSSAVLAALTPGLVADRIAASIQSSCTPPEAGRLTTVLDQGRRVALRGVQCPSPVFSQFVVVEAQSDGFYIHTVASFTPAGAGVAALSSSLADAVSATR